MLNFGATSAPNRDSIALLHVLRQGPGILPYRFGKIVPLFSGLGDEGLLEECCSAAWECVHIGISKRKSCVVMPGVR